MIETLSASYALVDFKAAYIMALQMQADGPIAYGPFIRNGSNCSRFVNRVILAGKPNLRYRIRLKYFVPFTPTPLNNVNALQHKAVLPVLRQAIPFFPVRQLSNAELGSTLPQPERHPDIPADAQWLSGEGGGSWFALEFIQNQLKVTRYAPDGALECSGMYGEFPGHLLDGGDSIRIAYPSNCKEVLLIKGSKGLHFSSNVVGLVSDHGKSPEARNLF